jgi:hypothetical protein
MSDYRRLTLALCLGVLVAISHGQANRPPDDLELTTVGEARLSTGRRGTFRIYTDPDGTMGTLTFGEFKTVSDAKQQISEWLKLSRKIASKEQERDESGRVIGDRIVAKAQNAKSGAKKFLIIRRDDTKCYLIESPSIRLAMQVEALTK